MCQFNCNVYVLIEGFVAMGDDSGGVLGMIDLGDLTEQNDLN